MNREFNAWNPSLQEERIGVGLSQGLQELSAKDRQVGGNHYKEMAIQPAIFCHVNNIGFIPGSIIKYICRYKKKGGIQDLEKAKHFLEMLIEEESIQE